MEPKIIWEKWKDPLLPLVKQHQDKDHAEPGYMDSISSFNFDEGNGDFHSSPNTGVLGPAIFGPMGLMPLTEGNIPSAVFNFWMGHTNFDITPAFVEVVQKIAGVESLEVFTRYRFRLGIGKAFKASEVKAAIDAVISPKMPSKIPVPLDAMKQMLSNKYPYWAIFVMPNGQFEYAVGKSIDEVNSKKVDGAEKTILSWE